MKQGLLSKIFFLDYKILHTKGFQVSYCPSCREYALLERLPHNTIYERLIKFFGFRKYHCTGCKWTGFRHTIKFTDKPKHVFRNYLIALFWLIIFGIILFYYLTYYFDTM